MAGLHIDWIFPSIGRFTTVFSIAHLEPAPKKKDPYNQKPWEIEKIIDKQIRPTGRVRYPVRWKGYGPEDDQWFPSHKASDVKLSIVVIQPYYVLPAINIPCSRPACTSCRPPCYTLIFHHTHNLEIQ
jgi:hypothetical protein